MAPSAASRALLVAALVHLVRGVRRTASLLDVLARPAPPKHHGMGPWPGLSHCFAELAGQHLCWEGPSHEPRLEAICGHELPPGGCKDQGFARDVSGASVLRFTALLGLGVFVDGDGEAPRGVEDAVMAGLIQNHGLGPQVKEGLKELGSKCAEALGPLVERLKLAHDCGSRPSDPRCVDILTSITVDSVVFFLLGRIETALAIPWIRRSALAHGIATKQHLNMPEPLAAFGPAVKEEVLPMWDAMKDIATRMLQSLLRTIVHPIMQDHARDILGSTFSEDSNADDLKLGDRMHVFSEDMKTEWEQISERIASWC